ncbi:HNH endonuclease [uncultured Xylophilus sp.]|uniref:HNH endonuclease n=1 Tax=uncultured Xylophilus sp. TaxID=296832 RepID=UPI0025EB0353|nr:HNH endonuclease [uncultured Xylophilus sp.]
MSVDILTSFINSAPVDLASAWAYDSVVAMSAMASPQQLMRDQEPLLRADQNRLWLRWFLDGMVSPHLAASDPLFDTLAIYETSLKKVNELYATVEKSRREALASAITAHVDDVVKKLRATHKRDYASPATRKLLIASTLTPRCYICGFEFSQPAVDAFLKVKGSAAITVPALLDVFRPRGLVMRDLGIEIDHIVPVASGGSGQNNLRIACGWCNKYKSDKVSLYEAPFLAARTENAFLIGPHKLFELPNPFWTIRILALRGFCQHFDGCAHSAKDAEMFVTPVDWKGSPNPTNLTVRCEHHLPFKNERRQASKDIEKLWGGRKK